MAGLRSSGPIAGWGALLFAILLTPSVLDAQGVTTGSMNGIVRDAEGEAVVGASVTAEHEPSGLQYGTVVREGGAYDLRGLRVGGPYTITVQTLGYETAAETGVFVQLNQTVRTDFVLVPEAVEVAAIQVIAEEDPVLNANRTGAATYVSEADVDRLPSIRRSTRDLTRLDPRSDGNFSFAGRNWLYNNISLDGSYFNNPFGLDDPAPGGQTNAEPVPYDAVEQVQVSLAPFDIRESGFTGASINSVTKSGTNEFRGTVYTFYRNESFIGDEVRGVQVLNPDLKFNQSGFSVGGPIVRDKLFFFVNGELERRDDPGSNFQAARPGLSGPTVSRVRAADLEAISDRLREVYGYETGPFEGFIHATDNDKLLAKIDWNVNTQNKFTFRYNLLDAVRELPPHPFAISINNTGRGPNENSLPFQNSGYAINNELNSFVFELHSQYDTWANRAFVSYNRFRDFRQPFSEPFPTIEIGVDGITYTTVGHEPFSINNLLDQDVWQVTNDVSLFRGSHVYTVGTNFESFEFGNSFNLFFYGLFPAPVEFGGTTFSSLEEFFEWTDPTTPNFVDFNAMVAEAMESDFGFDPFHTGQWALYAQDEWLASDNLTLTYGVRVDVPLYFTDLAPTPMGNGLPLNGGEQIAWDEFPDTQLLWSPRFGFNWDVYGDRSMQVRGGTGMFTGRLPFVWLSNQATNRGPDVGGASLVAAVDDFKWPQVWRGDIAVDRELPGNSLVTLEVLVGKTVNDVFIRNPSLADPVGTIPGPDGRVRYDPDNNRTNAYGETYVTDNSSDGYDVTFTAQLRKMFDNGLTTNLSYNFTEAKDLINSTEIASFVWSGNPVEGSPNAFDAHFTQFGHRNRIVGSANYRAEWSDHFATSLGLFFEAADGGFFTAGRSARFSYTVLGDLNGDGVAGNDLIYIPRDASEINFDPIVEDGVVVATPEQQWAAFDAFIAQDDYLSEHRGRIAERNGGLRPWFTNLDLRILQDVIYQDHAFQISLDVLNLANLVNSDWGVREVPNSAATSPLELIRFNEGGEPVFQFPGTVTETFVDDVSELSRWRAQIGFRYLFR